MTAATILIDTPIAVLRLFGSRAVAFGIAYAILVLALLLAADTVRSHRRFRRQAAALTRALSAAPHDGHRSPPDRLEQTGEALAGSFLAALWAPYHAAIEPHPTRQGVLVNLLSPSDWFALDRLPGRSYARWLTAWPGLFLTLGLLCTFIGLAAALLQVGAISSGTDMVEATDSVLRVSSAKFIASISGLACYIGWTLLSRRIATSDGQAAQRLAAAIQGLSSPLQPEALLFLAVQEATRQTAQLGSAPDAIGAAVERRLEARLAAIGRQITGAADALSLGVTDTVARLREVNEDAIREMAQQLAEAIRQGAGVEMRAVTTALRDATAELVQARTGIAEAGGQLHRELAAAANALTAAATVVDVAVSGSARAFGEVLGRSAEASGAKLAKAVTDTADTMTGKIRIATSQWDEAAAALLERLTAITEQLGHSQVAMGSQAREFNATGVAMATSGRELAKASTSFGRAVKPVNAALELAQGAQGANEALLADARRAIAALSVAAADLRAARALERHPPAGHAMTVRLTPDQVPLFAAEAAE